MKVIKLYLKEGFSLKRPTIRDLIMLIKSEEFNGDLALEILLTMISNFCFVFAIEVYMLLKVTRIITPSKAYLLVPYCIVLSLSGAIFNANLCKNMYLKRKD